MIGFCFLQQYRCGTEQMTQAVAIMNFILEAIIQISIETASVLCGTFWNS
jgi:hypothetical protein